MAPPGLLGGGNSFENQAVLRLTECSGWTGRELPRWVTTGGLGDRRTCSLSCDLTYGLACSGAAPNFKTRLSTWLHRPTWEHKTAVRVWGQPGE